MIKWATNLSALPTNEFGITVDAYIKETILIATGTLGFAVDSPPVGWVFK
jgi:hypothetical protein